MKHLDDELILDYTAERASESDQWAVESHATECADCLQRLRACRFLQQHFDAIWESWSAAEYGLLEQRRQLSAGMMHVVQAELLDPSLAQRARDWLQHAWDGTAMAFRLLIDEQKRIALAAASALPAAHAVATAPALEARLGMGVAAGTELQAAREQIARSAELFNRGETESAVRELLRTVEIDARLPQASRSQVTREGKRFVEVVVESRRREVYVKCWPAGDAFVPALALLLPLQADASPRPAALDQQEEGLLVAEFSDVPDGQYSLWLLPLPPSATQEQA
jgi:hypothetical protein